MDWYEEANKEIQRRLLRHGVSMEVACGVVATLSPMLQWERTIDNAEVLISHVVKGLEVPKYVAALGRQRSKAIAMVKTGNVQAYLAGPKVMAFYDNLLRPIESTAVTVDRHMIAWHGKHKRLSNKLRLKIESEIVSLANQNNVLPSQMQAILWEEQRARKRKGIV